MLIHRTACESDNDISNCIVVRMKSNLGIYFHKDGQPTIKGTNDLYFYFKYAYAND